MRAGVVIAGAGQGGFQTAASLRSEGYDGAITLIGDEPHIPYQRPPLSKGFAAGKQDADSLRLRPEGFYGDHRIELMTGRRVMEIDRARRCVRLDTGTRLDFEKLVLATGARNRQLRLESDEPDGVCYLRTRDEAVALVERLETAENLVVIGGGFIGLEVASVARSLGKHVVVVEAQPRVMPRVVAPVVSEYYERLHRARGVEFRFGSGAQRILRMAGRVSGVELSDGTRLAADLVVVGIGVVAETGLAEACGLAVADGVVVDNGLRTADRDIYAIGDCAAYPSRFAGGMVRLESVQNAVDHARCVAAGIAGRAYDYDALPWFWTDQFEVRLQMAGWSQGCEETVMRGDPASDQFSVLYFRGGRLAAVDSINRPGDHMAARKLLAAGTAMTVAEAGDLSVELKAWAGAVSKAERM